MSVLQGLTSNATCRQKAEASRTDSHTALGSLLVGCQTFNLRVLHENQEPVSQSGAGGHCPCRVQVSHGHCTALQGEPRLCTVFFLWMLETDRDLVRGRLQVDETPVTLSSREATALPAPQRRRGRCAQSIPVETVVSIAQLGRPRPQKGVGWFPLPRPGALCSFYSTEGCPGGRVSSWSCAMTSCSLGLGYGASATTQHLEVPGRRGVTGKPNTWKGSEGSS